MSISISDKAQEKLSKWHADMPVFGLMGEYSAGKSTLLNFLINKEVAPTQVTATNLPPLWITFSKTPFCRGLRGSGAEEAVDLSKDTSNLRETFVLLRIGLPAEALKHYDVIDTPGISDPTLPKGALRFLSKYLDFVVWCSAANQAWRQTEKAAWSKLAKAVRDESILVLTRADKLRSSSDLEKVVRRVQNETADLFKQVVALKTTKAAEIDGALRTADPDGAWADTGALAFHAALSGSVSIALEKCEKRRAKRKQETGSSARISHQKSTSVTSHKMVATAFQDFSTEILKMSQNQRVQDRLDRLKCAIDNGKSRSVPQDTVLVACMELSDEENLEFERTLLQVEADVACFLQDEWVNIGD